MPTVIPIPYPGWAAPFDRSVHEGFGEENIRALMAFRTEILEIVHQAVQDYLNNPTLAFQTAAEGFPSWDRLTGGYYMSNEAYWVNDEPWFPRVGRKREHRFSFFVRCIEHPQHGQEDQDYLGLEVHFDWCPETRTFRYHGDVDSSVI